MENAMHKDNIIWHKGERVLLSGKKAGFGQGLKPLFEAIVLTGHRAGKADFISEEHLISIGAI